MKNPNRYGCVCKLSGNRRRPWIVREGTSGKQRAIGYAATKEEALLMLAEYNRSPYDIDMNRLTLENVYELWLETKAPRLSASNRRGLTGAYKNYFSDLKKMQYSQIRAFQMQRVIDNCGKGYSTQARIKNLWRHLDRFAKEMDIIQKYYSDLLVSDSIPDTTRTVFTKAEIENIWDNASLPWADSLLFLLYTGFRISEMFALRTEHIDLNENIITGGGKTRAGRNRIIPIHSKNLSIVRERFSASKGGYLFEHKGKMVNETTYRRLWGELMEVLETEHTPHECRHTFCSELDSNGANSVCIDRLMGHRSPSTGKRIYTHKDIEELRKTIELISY